MKLVTYTLKAGGDERIGALVAGRVVDLTGAAHAEGKEFPASMLELVQTGNGALETARELIAGGAGGPLLEEVTLRAPLRPGKIVGVGLNYAEHVDESSRSLDTDKELPSRPVLFSKPSTAVIGPEEPIRHDGSLTAQLDWESELAVVIGRPTSRVRGEEARAHIFGYTITNDISARDQRRSGQWFFSKGQDSYAPLGPVLVTADELSDPDNLDIRLRVNGVTKQDSNTRHMLFKIPHLIEDISSGMTLEPGDVIATGSPSGVGAGRVPPEFLVPGDVVEAEVEGIGILRNPVVDVQR